MQQQEQADEPILHYQANRYAPRSQSLYVASLYRDPPDSEHAEEAERCRCGGYDPLHVHDAESGLVRRDEAARSFRHYCPYADQMDARSCDRSKRSALQPPCDEVDDCTRLSRPPPPFPRPAPGHDRHLPFELWLGAKHAAELQAEAEAKRAALGQLARHVARRVRAQREFEEWSRRKTAEQAQRQTEALQAAPPPLTAEQRAQRDRERERAFRAWSARADRERRSSSKRARVGAQAQSLAAQRERQHKRAKSQELYEAWKAEADQSLAQRRAERRKTTAERRVEKASEEQQRAAKSSAHFAEWKGRKQQQLRRQAQKQRQAVAEEKEREDKRAKQVQDTRPEREKRLAAHFRALIHERLAAESESARVEQERHRQIWAKKLAPVAYSTLERPQIAFR